MKTFALAFALVAACGLTPPSSSLPSLPSLPSSPKAPAVPAGLESKAPDLEDQAAKVGAHAVADVAPPDPDPPAHMGSNAKPEGPGGPLSDAVADCGPQHNHCMRGGGYILTGYNVTPVFKFSG